MECVDEPTGVIPEKGGERKLDFAEARVKALNAFLEHLGKISNAELSKMTGVCRETIGRWRRQGKWDARVSETRHLTDKKIVEKAATVLADKVTPEYTDILQNMAGVNAIVRAKLVARDAEGEHHSQSRWIHPAQSP